MKLVMEIFRKVFSSIIFVLFLCCFIFTNPKNISADMNLDANSYRKEIIRSLENLQDLDSQTWQIIVYPSLKNSNNTILRIVGHPGSLRFDHPTNLVVNSGRKSWDLIDITKKNKDRFDTLNDSVAEFDISPLISKLDKNRPLRLSLPGLINDLPIPPYLVGEWRTLVN